MQSQVSKPKSNVEWQKWAYDDPLYAIATRKGRNRNGTQPWTLPEFYEYGAVNWSEYCPHWQQYGVDRESCLEIGCGAGRITRQLVRYFNSVHAVDISPEMLGLAKRNVPEANFLLSDGISIPMPYAYVSADFSCEVFQHFDNRRIALSYFREVYRLLRPGGTWMIQLPIVVLPLRRILPMMGTIQRFLWNMTESWVRAKSNIKRCLISRYNRRPFLFLIQYEPDWLSSNLSKIGLSDIEIRLFGITGDPGETYIDSHVFARKRPGCPQADTIS